MLLTTASAWAWTDSGTSSDPYQINNASDLQQLATNVNNGTNYSGKYFLQTADINMQGVAFTPIGTGSNQFMGTYDGDSKKISGLTISSSYTYAGLFGYTHYNANSGSRCYLENIIVENCNIDVSGTNDSYAAA